MNQRIHLVVAARRNLPLVIGLGQGENFVGSDVTAFIAHTREARAVEQDQVVEVRRTGVVVTDLEGRLLTFGAILRIGPDALKVARAVEGARTLAALAASYHGPVLKVSEDGFLTMYLGGRRVWEM